MRIKFYLLLLLLLYSNNFTSKSFLARIALALVNVFVKEKMTDERFCFHNHLVDNSQMFVLLSCHDIVSLIVHYKKTCQGQIYLNDIGQFICLLRQQFCFSVIFLY